MYLRLSLVADSLLPFLTSIYDGPVVNTTMFDYSQFDSVLSKVDNATADQYLMTLAHQKEKMILKFVALSVSSYMNMSIQQGL